MSYDGATIWLTSKRWPSGSRKNARISPCSHVTGGVRKLAPRSVSRLYAAQQSGARITSCALTVSGSGGGAKDTRGLSLVGPPPVTRSNQSPRNFSTTDASYSRTTSALRTSQHQALERSAFATTSSRVSSMPSCGTVPAMRISPRVPMTVGSHHLNTSLRPCAYQTARRETLQADTT